MSTMAKRAVLDMEQRTSTGPPWTYGAKFQHDVHSNGVEGHGVGLGGARNGRGPGANYEPYDDSDLLGDFERPRKLHFGMNINVGKAGGASSVFYNGAGTGELGDVFRGSSAFPSAWTGTVAEGSGNTVRNRIRTSGADEPSPSRLPLTSATTSASASDCGSCSASTWRMPLSWIWTSGA